MYNACAWYAFQLVKGLNLKGHDVRVMGDSNSPFIRKCVDERIPVIPDIEFHSNSFNPLVLLKNAARYKQYLRDWQPDIINVHRGEDHVWSVLCNQGAKLIRTRGDIRFPRNNISSRWLHSQLDGYIVPAAYMVEQTPNWFKNKTTIKLIKPPLDLALYKLRPEPTGRFTIGLIGRLGKVKGHKFMLDVIADLKSDIPDIQLIIAGRQISEGPSYKELEAIVQEKGITNNVTFLGHVSDVREVIEKIHIGVVPSNGSEAISRIALEMMASGIPVLVSNLNGLPDTIGDAGLVLPIEDLNAWREAILNLYHHPQTRYNLAAKTRNRVIAENAYDDFIIKHEKFFEELLNNSNSTDNTKSL
jgi:glycosyltransferase involved in cell wall biosynthesis